MHVAIKPFPWGSLEGAPALAISLDGEVLPSCEALQIEMRTHAAMAPSLRYVWLERVPWAVLGAEQLIVQAMAQMDFGMLRLISSQEIENEHWPSLNVSRCVDVTSLAVPVDERSIEQRCDALPPRPHIHEIFVRGSDIDRRLISSGVLDALSRGTRCLVGYLYASRSTYDLAVAAVCRASYVWNVRHGH